MMEKLFRDCVPWFERQVLAFPLVVVLVACVTFFFGGHCAAWQWWVSVGLILALPFAARANRCAGLVSGGLFLVTLVALFACVRFTRDSYWVDAIAYHFPATRLLIDGWNPLEAATPSALGAAMSVDPAEMRVMHVLFVQKAAWFFNAVAFFFHRDVQSVTTPIEFYAFFMASVVLWRVLDFWKRPFRLLAVLALWTFCAGHTSEVVGIVSMAVVDDVTAMCVFALMAAMVRNLVRRTVSWDRLVPLSLLVVIVKSSGALACFVLWALFALVVLVRNRREFGRTFVRFAVAAVGMAVYFGIVCASPYWTAYREYGHPLYPLATVDEEKLPKTDFIIDLNWGTEDMGVMGPVGFFVNAYVSPSLAQGYYNRKLHREDFHPTCSYWRGTRAQTRDVGSDAETTITDFSDRVTLWIAFAILLCLPGWRMLPAMAFLVLIAAPSHTYGYLRYFKCVEMLLPFAVIALAEFGWRKFESRGDCLGVVRFLPVALAVVATGYFAFGAVKRAAQDVADKRYVSSYVPPARVYSNVFTPHHWATVLKITAYDKDCPNPNFKFTPVEQMLRSWHEDPTRTAMAGFKTLAKRLPNLAKTEVRPLTPELRAEFGDRLRYDPLLAIFTVEGEAR